MYVGRVNWLMIECRVVENTSTWDDICGKVSLKRVTTMAEGAPKGNSSVTRGMAAMMVAKKGSGGSPRSPNKGGSSGPIRTTAVAQ